MIIGIATQLPGRCWYNGDRAFCLQAAASNLIKWSQINSDSYHYHTSVAVQTSRPQISRTREPRGDQNASTACKSCNTGACSSHHEYCRSRHKCDRARCDGPCTPQNRVPGIRAQTRAYSGDMQPANSRVGVNGANKTNIFSCLLVQNNFEFPYISSVTPINVDNLSLQLCGQIDIKLSMY